MSSPRVFNSSSASMDDRVLLQRKTIRMVLEQCQKTLELLNNAGEVQDLANDGDGGGDGASTPLPGSSPSADNEADELRELLKSKVESQDFLEKLGSIHMSVSNNISADDSASWNIVNSKDLWEDKNIDEEQNDFVHVNQEDIVEAIACFMAAYLLSLKETKDLTPNQLQKALSKTFSTKGKKSRLRKAWDGSVVLYNVASWSATAIGMYRNPAILRTASMALWSSCRALSKFI